MRLPLLPAVVFLLIGSASLAADAPLFPFSLPWDDASPSVADMAGNLEKPAGKHGHVTVRDGHLFAGPGRLRLLGVNLCFGANFPTHADASKVAARLARFGINAVRFHHMDMMNAPDGIFARDGKTLDPDRLDRLDFLISELKNRGIYADLNLHVSRTYPDMPKWPGMPEFHKGVDNFHPRMIEWQRQYARDLLTHKNPYTNNRYVDEPAVAIVEINNENALMQDWFGGRLDDMPDEYARVLAAKWHDHLRRTFSTEENLREAWSNGAEPLGPLLLTNGNLASGLAPWVLEKHGGAEAGSVISPDGPDGTKALHVRVTKPGRESWHVQVNQSGLKLDAEKSYTLDFQAKSDRPRRLALTLSQAHEPWDVLASSEVEVGPEWREHQVAFRPSKGDARARLVLSGMGADIGEVAFATIRLRTGGVSGLAERETLDTVPLFRKRDYGRRSQTARIAWVRFLAAVETEYWTGMAKFLKDDLGVKCPIVGTQMGWSPFEVQAKLDVIDSHAYWHHPAFPPGKGWDPANWTVKNEPMTAQPDGGTLPGLALSRVAGKPFLCTEYNDPAPITYSSEAFPLLSGFAGAQDWDGIFAFAYSHRRDAWDADHFGSFFDIDRHPAKMVTMPAAFAAFVRGDVPSFPQAIMRVANNRQLAYQMERSGPYVSGGSLGITRSEALQNRVSVATDDQILSRSGISRQGKPGLQPFDWEHKGPGQGVVTIRSARSKALVGTTGLGPVDLNTVTIDPGPNRQNWAAITLTAIDANDFRSPGRILVTATGYVENTDMGWKNPEKTTVGTDWGRGPTLVEGIPATITLPVRAANVRAWPLDERGHRRDPIPVRDSGGRAAISIGPEFRTLWYEVLIRAE